MQDQEDCRESGESSDEFKSMSSSSVIVMPQAVNDVISRTSSLTIGGESDSDTSSISLLSVDSDEEGDEEWEDSRDHAPAEDTDEYIVLYDDDSE